MKSSNDYYLCPVCRVKYLCFKMSQNNSTFSSNGNQPEENIDIQFKLSYSDLPKYLKTIVAARNYVKNEYLVTKNKEKQIEYYKLRMALRTELDCYKNKMCRRNSNRLYVKPEGEIEESTLPAYISELIDDSIRIRHHYRTEGIAFFRIVYKGIDNAVHTLQKADDERRDEEKNVASNGEDDDFQNFLSVFGRNVH